jgi:anti-anti-sigma factor
MPHPAADCTISLCNDAEHVHLAVSGEVDMEMRPHLNDALRRVSLAMPRSVYVDLADVTFAGSTLANFLLRVRQALPDESPLVLCRPAPTTHLILRITDLTRLATVRDDIPACSA